MTGDAFTVLDDGTPHTVRATVDGEQVRLEPGSLAATLGWRLEPQGLCRGDVCVPIRARGALVAPSGVDLVRPATVLDRPLALDVGERAGWLGTSARARGMAFDTLEAPELTLPDLDGRPHRLADHRGRKVFLLAFASW